jgi:hypothetical protein
MELDNRPGSLGCSNLDSDCGNSRRSSKRYHDHQDGGQEPGISWRHYYLHYTVTNNTAGVVNGLTLVDDKLGTIPLSANTLDAGGSLTATTKHKVEIGDFPGPIDNIATATGLDASAATITAAASLSVSLNPYQASLSLTKSADKSTASPHETVTYTYTIGNNGPVAVSGLVLTDSKLGPITMTVTSLDPGKSTTATKTYVVVVGDLPGHVVNTATVSGNDPAGKTLSATSASISVALTINKALLTKAEVLTLSGVPGKGISKAPGLQKPFNPKSKAAEKAGKKK